MICPCGAPMTSCAEITRYACGSWKPADGEIRRSRECYEGEIAMLLKKEEALKEVAQESINIIIVANKISQYLESKLDIEDQDIFDKFHGMINALFMKDRPILQNPRTFQSGESP